MRIVTLIVAATVLSPTLAFPHGIEVQQNGWANVYGLVQAGPWAGPVTVRQSGMDNVVGIVQAGPNSAVTVLQTGRRNVGFVGQFAPPSIGQLP